MVKLTTAVLLLATLVCAVAGQAELFPFPDSIGMCGKGVCKVIPVIKDETGMAIGVGPVPAGAKLGETGDYPSIISLCGMLTCVTVPVVREGVEGPVPGTTPESTCPSGIGLCGDGGCKVVPVNVDADGNAMSVGPVAVGGPQGAPGSYPTNVGVCCNGVCKALPVLTGRKTRRMALF